MNIIWLCNFKILNLIEYKQVVMKFLVIGHVTLDLGPEVRRLGGAIYAALALRGRGRVTLLTSGPGWLTKYVPSGIKTILVPSGTITTFRLERVSGGRILHLLNRAEEIDSSRMPDPFSFDAVILDPVIGECDRFPPLIPKERLSVDAQGFVRGTRGTKVVIRSREPFPARVLHGSRTEVEALGGLGTLSRLVDHILVTEGPRGGILVSGGKKIEIPEPDFLSPDDTGAGDYLLASYTYHSLLVEAEEALHRALEDTWGFLRGRSGTEPPPVPGE